MSILLYGVGPGDARLATNDLTHDLRHQAARRASKKHHCKAGVSLPRSRMLREHEAHPNRPQGSFIHVFPRPWPGGVLLGICFWREGLEATFGPERRGAKGGWLTHEHGDHINGVDVLLRTRDIPVYTNALTREVLRDQMKSEIRWVLFDSGQEFKLGEFSIRTFKIPHDAVEPVGFVFIGKNVRLGMVTDVGYVTESIREELRGSHGICIEANYDQGLLERDTKRPWGTKQRIVSRHGHLSNTETAGLLAEVACERLNHVILSHLSPDCNCPNLASETVRTQLAERGHVNVQVQCAREDQPSEWVNIS